MKSVLISIQPKWCEAIAAGEKTIEVRKTCPKIKTPFRCYIYETNNTKGVQGFSVLGRYRVGKVIGEFICNKVEKFNIGSLRSDDIEKLACLSYYEMICYFYKPEELDGKTAKQGFAWHISDLKIYDKPKELGEFHTICNKYGNDSCGDCPYLEVERCSYPCDDSVDTWCSVDNIKPITHAPRGWQYVEE